VVVAEEASFVVEVAMEAVEEVAFAVVGSQNPSELAEVEEVASYFPLMVQAVVVMEVEACPLLVVKVAVAAA